jgi:hypothetical protein
MVTVQVDRMIILFIPRRRSVCKWSLRAMYELTMNDHYAMCTFHDLLLTLFKGLTKFFHVVYSRKQVKKIS